MCKALCACARAYAHTCTRAVRAYTRTRMRAPVGARVYTHTRASAHACMHTRCVCAYGCTHHRRSGGCAGVGIHSLNESLWLDMDTPLLLMQRGVRLWVRLHPMAPLRPSGALCGAVSASGPLLAPLGHPCPSGPSQGPCSPSGGRCRRRAADGGSRPPLDHDFEALSILVSTPKRGLSPLFRVDKSTTFLNSTPPLTCDDEKTQKNLARRLLTRVARSLRVGHATPQLNSQTERPGRPRPQKRGCGIPIRRRGRGQGVSPPHSGRSTAGEDVGVNVSALTERWGDGGSVAPRSFDS